MISRRNFLKQSIFGAGMIASRPWRNLAQVLEDWPDAERLGRNCTGGIANIRVKPSAESQIVNRYMRITFLFGCGKWLAKRRREFLAAVG